MTLTRFCEISLYELMGYLVSNGSSFIEMSYTAANIDRDNRGTYIRMLELSGGRVSKKRKIKKKGNRYGIISIWPNRKFGSGLVSLDITFGNNEYDPEVEIRLYVNRNDKLEQIVVIHSGDLTEGGIQGRVVMKDSLKDYLSKHGIFVRTRDSK